MFKFIADIANAIRGNVANLRLKMDAYVTDHKNQEIAATKNPALRTLKKVGNYAARAVVFVLSLPVDCLDNVIKADTPFLSRLLHAVILIGIALDPIGFAIKCGILGLVLCAVIDWAYSSKSSKASTVTVEV